MMGTKEEKRGVQLNVRNSPSVSGTAYIALIGVNYLQIVRSPSLRSGEWP